MHATTFTVRALVAAGLGLVLLTATGCPRPDTCEVHTDCAEGEMCNDDGVCEEITDLCHDAADRCRGGQTCNADTGACEGDCCTQFTCDESPGATCDEERCLDGVDPCVAPRCEPACGENEVCNLATETCEAACLSTRCAGDPVYYKCDTDAASPTYGECGPGVIAEGEVGWPCEDSTVCTDGTTCNTDLGMCTQSCTEDSQCPVGAFCQQLAAGTVCLLTCDTDGFQDCPPNTQCIDDLGLPHPICLEVFPLSDCENDCLPEHSVCDPDAETEECEAGLSCVAFGDDATCQRVQCHYLDGGCAHGDRCLGVGNNLSVCFQGCDPADPNACDGPFDGCLLENRIDGPRDTFWFAVTADQCTSAGYDAQEIPGGGGYTCYAACDTDADCGAGQFCNELELFDGADPIASCVNYAILGGTCADGPCPGDTTCEDLGGTGDAASVACFLGCDDDDDCTDAHGGGCRRFGFTGGGEMNICVYLSEGAFCLWGCDGDDDCGYCESDDDCGQARGPDGVNYDLRCDHASRSCVMPVATVAQVSQRCRVGQTRNPNGIELADGSTTGGCATECTDDLDCAGSCVDGYCRPVTQLCNAVTGQCEATCDDGDQCVHGSCAGERCVLGCEETADCGGLGVCYENEVNYCVLDCADTGCAEGSTCDSEGDGLCYADPEWVSFTVDGVDVIAEGAVTYVQGTGAEIVWEAVNADGIRIFVDDYDSEGCPDADSEDWTEMGTDDASGTIAVPAEMAGNHCVMVVAENHLVGAPVVFTMVDRPGVTVTITSVVGLPPAASTVNFSIQLARVSTLVVTAQEYNDAGEPVGDAREVASCERDYPTTPSSDTVSCSDQVTFVTGDLESIVYTATVTDPEGDENEHSVTVDDDDPVEE